MLNKILTVVLAAVISISALTACGGDDASSDTHHATDMQKQEMNTYAKLVYTVTMNLCYKAMSEDKKFSASEVKTDMLLVEYSDEEPDISNIKEAKAGSGIPAGNIKELKKAINSSVSEDTHSFFYIVEFDSNGFPTKAYASRKEDGSFVGQFPQSEDGEDLYSLKDVLK